jgi:hypothetical protein
MDTNDLKRIYEIEILQFRIFIEGGLPGRTLVLLINYSKRLLTAVLKPPRARSKRILDLFALL